MVTPLEKMDDGSGDSDAIYVGENSYVALWRHALRCRSKDKLPPMEIGGSTEKKRWKEYEAVKMSRARWKSIGNMES